MPVPRYTSYPTVPMWQFNDHVTGNWVDTVRRVFEETNQEKGISLYLHLPFCESLCTYCGCNKHITINHQVEHPYIQSILKEFSLYKEVFTSQPKVTEMHLGGGTPTFFSPENLHDLLTKLLADTAPSDVREFSFEGHPNSTTLRHLEVLHELGFNRVSFGVQDFDEQVQKAIHRIQPHHKVVEAVENSRKAGYESVNFDLIFGLPHQNEKIIKDTFIKVLDLMPERIAYYSYAHVPWKSPSQRGYDERDLPGDVLKRRLYEIGKEMLLNAGYVEIGMDHFALPQDSLHIAYTSGNLHRNFMGYTVCNTDLMLGLGASSISDAKYAYAQNEKKVKDYQQAIASETLPIINGHLLSDEDLKIKVFIKNLICNGKVSFETLTVDNLFEESKRKLEVMVGEGLIEYDDQHIRVTEKGKPFIRNICNLFDLRHWASATKKERYSKSI